jgi:fatty acid desaturase
LKTNHSRVLLGLTPIKEISLETEITTPSAETSVTKPSQKLNPQSFYAQRLRAELPPKLFEPFRLRLVWAGSYAAVAGACLVTVASDWQFALPLAAIWALKFLLSVTAGICIGGLGFFAHEVLHGSVVKNKSFQNLLGFFGFMPWFIGPTFWRFWHNQLHHGKTQSLIQDPDAFPTLKIFKHSKFIKFMFPFTPGSGHKRSFSYFFFWFSFHVFVAQVYLRFRNSVFERLDHKRVTLEMAAQMMIWIGFLMFLGPENLVWTWFIPFLTQNYFAMSYIATNHNLSPLTRVNDPLANSLTVTNIGLFENLHLNFGYHVEHHILPTVSGVHAKKVHAILKRDFPETFLHMPKREAIKRLYKTSRIYRTSDTLLNPETGATYPTLSRENVTYTPTV